MDGQARYSSNTILAGEMLDLAGKTVVDVGCGEGRFTRFLASQGARVTGIDVKQAALDRAAELAAGEGLHVDWRNARAEALPFADQGLDIVVFSNSLHHVAPEAMGAALGEAARVLRPGGELYIMEPVAEGPFFEATRLVNDERAVRAEALAAIRAAEAAGFESLNEVTYLSRRRYGSFEDYEREQRTQSETRARLFDENGSAIRERFLAAAEHEDGKLAFDQVFRINHLRKRSSFRG